MQVTTEKFQKEVFFNKHSRSLWII